jgi:transposase-like protein
MSPSFLDPAERNDLWTRGVHGPDPALARRARALLALDQGFPPARVARMCGCSRHTLWDWRRRYLEDRVCTALADRRTDRTARRTAALRRPAHAAALCELARQHGPTAPRAGRLALAPRDAARLCKAARSHPVEKTRYRAALLLAYDRGAPVCALTAAGACARSTVYDAPRHLPRLLEALRALPAPREAGQGRG